MVNRMTILGLCAAALGAAASPHAAAAADYYDGGRPPVFQGRDDLEIDGDRAGPAYRDDLRPARPHRGYGPGPVVFDERDSGRRYGGPADRRDGWFGRYGEPVYGERRPVVVERPAYGYAAPHYAPRFVRPAGPAFVGDVGPYRAASVYREVDGPGFDERAGVPDVGCTVEESRSTTPAGWRKVVTHRTCYRR